MYKGILYFETCVYDGESHQKRTKVSVRTRPRGFLCAGEDEGVWVLLEEDDCGCDEGVDMFVECFGRLDLEVGVSSSSGVDDGTFFSSLPSRARFLPSFCSFSSFSSSRISPSLLKS